MAAPKLEGMFVGLSGLRTVFAAALLMYAAASTSTAATISYAGNFATDDELQIFTFTLAAQSTVTLQTLSFGGGINGGGTVIAPGGFETVLSLFDGSGTQNLLAQDVTGGTAPGGCGGRGIDPGSGFCLDAFLQQSLNAGTYLVALTESDNTANGPTFGDGFGKQGQGNFTGPEFTGQPGSFILFDGSQRTGAWAFDLSGVAPVPEPLPIGLLAAGLTAVGLFRFKRKRSTGKFLT